MATKTLKHVIVGDLHCDRKRKVTYGDSSIWDGQVFNILQDIIKTEKPDLLVLLGDIFDSYKPDSISVTRLISILAQVKNVVIVEGNHDRPKNSDLDYVFQHLISLDNITTASANTVTSLPFNQYALGWHSNQALFEESLEKLLKNDLIDSFVYLHCNTDDFGNQNDNYISEELREKLTAAGATIFTGHDHSFKQVESLINLGSIIPNTIAELGPKYYWSSTKGLVETNHGITGDITDTKAKVYLLREEPTLTDVNKAYYVKPTKEVSKEDLTLQSKNLGINIFEDLKTEAIANGFDEEFINDLFKEL